MSKKEEIQISLNKDEALILFDYLARFNIADHNEISEDRAIQRVLSDIESLLEKQLAQPFLSDYEVLLKEARNRIRDKE